VCAAPRTIYRAQCILDFFAEKFRLRSRREAPTRATKHRVAKITLEVRNESAQRGLRDMHALGRSRHGTGLHDSYQRLELTKRRVMVTHNTTL
jgi:hypothetical protein